MEHHAPFDRQSDELLAIRCQLGESAAFDDLITRWHAPLWGYVRRLAPSDEAARDIVQELWLRVIRGIPRLRDPSKLRPWLFGIARRTLMDRLREQYSSRIDDEVDVHALADNEPDGSRAEDLQDLDNALAALPIVEREVITLFYLEELSLLEVAETLRVPVGTVKSRLFRARRMLRGNMAAGG